MKNVISAETQTILSRKSMFLTFIERRTTTGDVYANLLLTVFSLGSTKKSYHKFLLHMQDGAISYDIRVIGLGYPKFANGSMSSPSTRQI